MYKLQICNALTNEILREKTYKKPDLILDLIESGLKGQECFLFDEERRTYKGDYVTHSSYFEESVKCLKYCSTWNSVDTQARVAVVN